MYRGFEIRPASAISGLGDNVRKIIDSLTTETVAYVGKINELEVLHMVKPFPMHQLDRLVYFLKSNGIISG